jgi:hypothetical protein
VDQVRSMQLHSLSQSLIKLVLPNRLAMGDRKLITGSVDGSIDVWDIKDMLSGTVSSIHRMHATPGC